MVEYFPDIDDELFNEKLLSHSEFNELIQPYINSDELTDIEKQSILKARLLNTDILLKPYQDFVSRFISTYTPYNSLLLFHSPGSGKTLSLIRIIKSNMDYIVNQDSKVHIIVPTRLLKNHWYKEIYEYIPELLSYIRIITYKSMYNKVLGIRNVVIDEDTLKVSKQHSSKNVDFSEYNNSILVIEEAHNVTNNNYSLSIQKIKQNVKKIKIIALTATPIKNHSDEIIDILNLLIENKTLNKKDYFKYINNKPILHNGDKLLHDVRGYISSVNINDSIYMASKCEVGSHINGLEIIKVCKINCPPFYSKLIDILMVNKTDSLNKSYESVSNIIYPYPISDDKFIPLYGNVGINLLINLIKEDPKLVNSRLCSIFDIKNTNLLTINDNGTLSGRLFSEKYIGAFAPKILYTYRLISRLSGNIFVYSSFKTTVIDTLGELLINEGYTDFKRPNLGLESQKRCYICGQIQSLHTALSHEWHPITFFICSSNDATLTDTLNLFNSSGNIDGRIIKVILASMILNEGANLKNIIHVIKMDAPFTMARNEQIERRAIRLNSHNDYIIRNGVLPSVYVYNLALYTEGDKSVEISNYLLCEKKYKSNEEIFKILKLASIDVGVYDAKKPYSGKVVNSTRKLINKDNKIDSIVKYIKYMFTNINIMSYKDVLEELIPKFNDISVLISINYLIDTEVLFIVNMQNKIYLYSNTNMKETVDVRFMNIHNFYNIKKDVAENDYYYDIEYINSKKPTDITGILSNKFKLKFSNKIIDKLSLDIVKSKGKVNIMKGWICNQSVNKKNLDILVKLFKIEGDNSKQICDQIYNKLYDLEKYNDENIQFLIYPKNMKDIPFPINIYDMFNNTINKYESQGYKIINQNKHTSKDTIKFNTYEYKKVSFKFTCIKKGHDAITVEIE